MVLGTGSMSEMALGWATYNGDHMSMYAVNGGVPKTLVASLVRWIANKHTEETTKEVLIDILDTPFSPELLPADKEGKIAQKTEHFVGPYELHDFFINRMLRHNDEPRRIYFIAQQAFKGSYTSEEVLKWLKVFYRRFFSQQFKRSCMPDGPKVGAINLSPRASWRMPSDAMATVWLDELEKL
jgi:NAD+ synthase (glutamine-hydrolysing)